MSHQHAQAYFIKAWADGKDVEWFDEQDSSWRPVTINTPWFEERQYRIVGKTPRDISVRMFVEPNGNAYPTINQANVKLTFDGITYELKTAEVL